MSKIRYTTLEANQQNKFNQKIHYKRQNKLHRRLIKHFCKNNSK